MRCPVWDALRTAFRATRFISERRPRSMLSLVLADETDLKWAQAQVTVHHYLHRPVDARCSPVAYLVLLEQEPMGCLIFGRPQATRVLGWYGTLDDLRDYRCYLLYWQVINLARVWLDPRIQKNGACYIRNAATQVIAQALRRIVVDYLVLKAPVWPNEPYELRECLSYCQSDLHTGALYRAANFHIVRRNQEGLDTYRRSLRHLTHAEKALVINRSC